MAARIPTWHRKTDDELKEIVRLVWEGRIVGSWQLESHREVERIIPGYSEFEISKGFEEAGSAVFFAEREVAAFYSRVPWPAAAYGRLPGASRSTVLSTASVPEIPGWEIFSWEEWGRIRAFLGFPAPSK